MKLDEPKFGRFGASVEALIQVLDQFVSTLVGVVNGGAHAGLIKVWTNTSAPNGWLICDNAEYNQTKYEDLFKAIGQTYGGTTGTFRVPGGVHLPILPSADMIWIIRA